MKEGYGSHIEDCLQYSLLLTGTLHVRQSTEPMEFSSFPFEFSFVQINQKLAFVMSRSLKLQIMFFHSSNVSNSVLRHIQFTQIAGLISDNSNVVLCSLVYVNEAKADCPLPFLSFFFPFSSLFSTPLFSLG